MIALAIVAVLALLAVPGVPERAIRDQVADAVRFTEFVRAPIDAGWRATSQLPADNAAAGLPSADRIVSNHVASVAVESGAIQLRFGNQANGLLRGKTLTLRPGVVEDAPIVPVAWVCGFAEPPARMVARGLNKTDVPTRYLPLSCRAAPGATPIG